MTPKHYFISKGFFFLILEVKLSCGVTGTPVVNFWWRLPWVSKAGWISPLRAVSSGVTAIIFYHLQPVSMECMFTLCFNLKVVIWIKIWTSRGWERIRPRPHRKKCQSLMKTPASLVSAILDNQHQEEHLSTSKSYYSFFSKWVRFDVLDLDCLLVLLMVQWLF